MRLKTTLLAVLSVLCLGVGGGLSTPAVAQAPAGLPALPVDTAVRIGKLPNGLTYFIRHNEEPKGRAEFYIAQKVGSMQEEDSQQGLAHFLEHIAFNGTKNFPGKGLISFLESVGASFGGNINAYTSFDQTVYTLMKIPVPRPTVVDSCLLILHDWSNSISLEDKEIDAERGVIQEEWRSRDSGDSRNLEKLLAQAFPGNKYGQRMPIGKMDIIRTFPYQVLRDYYKKWYRPDLQGIIIVGDVDVDRTEAQLKKIFADIPAPVNPAERVYIPVEDNDKPLIAIAVDKEATQNVIGVSLKTDVTPAEVRASFVGLMEDYLNTIVPAVLGERFSDIVKKPNAPFLGASASVEDYLVAKTKDATNFNAYFKEGAWETALKGLVAEILRLKQYGITPAEYDRAKQDFLVSIKKRYDERNKRNSATWANEYVDYFLDGGYLLDIPTYYELMQGLVPSIGLQDINEELKKLDLEKNVLVALIGVDKPEAKVPTAELLAQKYQEAIAQQVTAPKNEVSNQKLIEKLPAKGRILKEQKDAQFGTTIWTLSNGTKVHFKKTDFKEDEILFSGSRDGGYLNFTKPAALDLKVLGAVSDLGGLGAFDASALEKALSGRIASVSTSVSDIRDAVSGNSTQADLETMLQLLYLNFTAIRADKEAFQAWQEQTISSLQAAKANPMHFLQDSLMRFVYPKNPELYPLTEQEVKAVNYDRVLQLYRSRFANARGFNFYFVGNIDEAKLRPLVEQYIASLPAQKTYTGKAYYERQAKDLLGTHTKEYSAAMATPTGIAIDGLFQSATYDLKTILVTDVLSGILDQLYVKTIREDEGGTYGVGVYATVSRHPQVRQALSIQFQTDPSKVDKLNSLVFKGLEGIAQDGPSQEYFDKTIANLKKSHAENLRKNSYWLGKLAQYFGQGFDFVTPYDATLESIRPADVQATVKQLNGTKNRRVIVFRSTEPAKK